MFKTLRLILLTRKLGLLGRPFKGEDALRARMREVEALPNRSPEQDAWLKDSAKQILDAHSLELP